MFNEQMSRMLIYRDAILSNICLELSPSIMKVSPLFMRLYLVSS
jgi:hypothetical protein